MHHRDFLQRVRSALGGTASLSAAELALDSVLRALTDGLAEDGEVRLAHFGTFRMKNCRPRRLRLPGDGRFHTLPAREQLRFSPSPSLKNEKNDTLM